MRSALLLLLLAACAPTDGPAVWALDTVNLSSDGEGGVEGLQTFALYREGWRERRSEQAFVCSVLLEVSGPPAATPCERCDHAWDVEARILEHDCEEALVASQPLFDGPTGLGLGAIAGRIDEAPPLDSASGSWIRYAGQDWTAHGWGWPDGVFEGTANPGPWNDAAPFVLWPAFAWDLRLD